MSDTQYRLMQDDFVIGVITMQPSDDDWLRGVIDLEESIKKRVGWKAVRYADALDGLADFLRVTDEFGDNIRSREFQRALERLEDDETGPYLVAVSDESYVLDERRQRRSVESLGYRDGGLVTWQWRDDAGWETPEREEKPLFSTERNTFSCRPVIWKEGRHRVGGSPKHEGAIPEGTETPLHHLLTIDLADLHSPFHYDPEGIRFLPLYYPLAYGSGGPEIQYSVDSDDKITILNMSDPQPDDVDEAYVEVRELPEAGCEIIPLTYEEIRVRALHRHPSGHHGSFPLLDPDDHALWTSLGGDRPICFGGPTHQNVTSFICRNPACKSFESLVELELIVSLPPFPIVGESEFWHEFEGAYMEFCFALCPDCRTIIAFNVCD